MNAPRLSIILIIHRMSRQADNTLHSLSARYQRNVDPQDYEIIAVENASDDVLGEQRARAHGSNVQYYWRDDKTQSPVGAINFAFERCRGPLIGLMIDGARMASPRVVEHALLASKLCSQPLIVVPGYHLGNTEHHLNVTGGHCADTEQALLEKVGWKQHGYRLFDISCLSAANPKGPLGQYLESNCIFSTRESFDAIGRADERFDLPGGGSVNIHMYHALARLPNRKLIVLAGEGTFHQFHGGVTTSEIEDREAVLESHRQQLRQINGGTFRATHREPFIFSTIPVEARTALAASAANVQKHFAHCRQANRPCWTRVAEDQAQHEAPAAGPSVLSMVVVSQQPGPVLERSLRSLSTAQQRGVDERQYEIVVVELQKTDMLGERRVLGLGKNFRYIPRHWSEDFVDRAFQVALSQCRSPLVGLFVEHSPILSPRTIGHVIAAQQALTDPVMMVPGYELHATDKPSWRLPWKQLRDWLRWPGRKQGVGRGKAAQAKQNGRGYSLFPRTASAPGRPVSPAAFHYAGCYFCPRSEHVATFAAALHRQPQAGYTDSMYWEQLQSMFPSSRPVILAGEGCFTENSLAAARQEAERVNDSARPTSTDNYAGLANHQAPLILGTFTEVPLRQLAQREFVDRLLEGSSGETIGSSLPDVRHHAAPSHSTRPLARSA